MMRKSMLIAIILLSFLFCHASYAEEYILDNCQTPYISSKNGDTIYRMPKGLTVYLREETDVSVQAPEELISILLPGMDLNTDMNIQIRKGDLIPKSEYDKPFDIPQAVIGLRTPLLSSIDESSRESIIILIPKDTVLVYARVGEYFYISYQNIFGYIPKNSVRRFLPDSFFREYHDDMSYTELDYVSGELDGSERITREQAIELAKEYLINNFFESREHLDRLDVHCSLNISHLYGTLGKTWWISFSGSIDEYFLQNVNEFADQMDEDYRKGIHRFYKMEIVDSDESIVFIETGDYG